MRLKLVTILPPVLNHTYYHLGPRLVLSGDARMYRTYIASEIFNLALKADPRGAYSGRITQHLKGNRRDVDANAKLVIDAIFAALGVNDNRLFHLELHKVIDGRDELEVEIWDAVG